MPMYLMVCRKCGVQKNEMMKYDEMVAGVTCDCGEEMKNKICPSIIKGFNTVGVTKAKEPIGPLHPKSRAYEKKHDEANSLDCYKPGGTFGNKGSKGFKERNVKMKQFEAGRTDFTKDK